MSEQRINTVLTEEETIKALKNQLNESEYKLLEKTLKWRTSYPSAMKSS